MAKYQYSNKINEENIGKAVMRDVAISPKHSIEICSAIRYKTVTKAKELLEAIRKEERPIKFTRFTAGAGHRTQVQGPGKFPVKAADNILKGIKSAESNASDKGLSKDLKIVHISAQRASAPWHYGRQRRVKMKRTHIEIILREMEQKKQEKKADNETKKVSEVEAKPEQPKITEKEEKQTEVKEETKSDVKEDKSKELQLQETESKDSEVSETKSSEHDQKPKVSDIQEEPKQSKEEIKEEQPKK